MDVCLCVRAFMHGLTGGRTEAGVTRHAWLCMHNKPLIHSSKCQQTRICCLGVLPG